MKKRKVILWMLILSMFVMTACSTALPGKVEDPGTKTPSVEEPRDAAAKAIAALKDYDQEALSKMVHPEKGVRFTPYAYVEADKDIVLTAQQIKQAGSDDKKYIWGSYDGSGEPIELTFEEYYKKFVYDTDFANAKEIAYNETLGKGNSLDNSKEFYKDAFIVEYHFPGIDPQYQGLDWRSLRLVFEELEGSWYLVGIIHDQWTI